MSDSTDHWPPITRMELVAAGFLTADMAVERARILALLTNPAVVEAMAHAHYRSQWPAVDDWDEGTDMWRAQHRDNMRAALDVLRARIEEDA